MLTVVNVMIIFVITFSLGCKKSSSLSDDDGTNNNGNTFTNAFSIDVDRQIYFSKGNLQYQASTQKWRFAEHQWDYVGTFYSESGETGGTVSGSSNHLISPSYSGWIDMFGWGTGAYPANTSTNYNDYNSFYDWGNNYISNGDGYNWRSLTYDEWMYLTEERLTYCGRSYIGAIVNDVKGVILLPDNWSMETYDLVFPPYYNDVSSNIISLDIWNSIFETNGAIFLPFGGSRFGKTHFFGIGEMGYYWLAPYYEDNYMWACEVSIRYNDVNISNNNNIMGYSVRLVRDVE